MSDGRPIFLVGFMGSGKSAVAERLAAALDWKFADSDRLVEERAGKTIERIFAEDGESEFRRAERAVVKELAQERETVVALGGGAFLAAATRKALWRAGRTVWLDVPFEVAGERVGDGNARPLWLPADPVGFRAFFEQRRSLYALARHKVDALGPIEQVADSIRAFLG